MAFINRSNAGLIASLGIISFYIISNVFDVVDGQMNKPKPGDSAETQARWIVHEFGPKNTVTRANIILGIRSIHGQNKYSEQAIGEQITAVHATNALFDEDEVARVIEALTA